jgi:hypothetical protein
VRRASARILHYYAHEVRAAHDAGMMNRLLEKLRDGEVILVADWKM